VSCRPSHIHETSSSSLKGTWPFMM
jgi:hypothetical protein